MKLSEGAQVDELAPVRGQGIEMVKRIAVFAAVVLGYVITGMALSASQPDRAGAPSSSIAVEAAILR